MKSLFRSIRRKLLDEGKLLRYLTYAIGETVLIVVGILIALKINDWNEDKKAQEQFDRYVAQLKVDASKAISVNQEITDYLLERAQSSFDLIVFLEGADRSEAALADFERNLDGLGRYRNIQLNVGLLGELLSGKTEIISRNPELYQVSMDVISRLATAKDVAEHVLRDVDVFRTQLPSYFSGTHRVIPEMDISYDLNALEESDEFNHLVRSIARRQASAHDISNAIVIILTEFLAQLEEYE